MLALMLKVLPPEPPSSTSMLLNEPVTADTVPLVAVLMLKVRAVL